MFNKWFILISLICLGLAFWVDEKKLAIELFVVFVVVRIVWGLLVKKEK